MYSVSLVGALVFLFPFLGNPPIQIWLGKFSLIIALGSVFFGMVLMNTENQPSGDKISSILTPLYKLYFPLCVLVLFLFNTILIVFSICPENEIDVFIAIEGMLIIWLLLVIPFNMINQLYVKNNKLIASNYFKSREFTVNDIVKIQRFLLFFYKIKLSNSSIIILPKISESAMIFFTPKSIKLLRNKWK